LERAYLDVVNGVNVVHAVLDDVADLLETLVGPHDRDGVTLHQHVALGQQLDGLERRSVGACVQCVSDIIVRVEERREREKKKEWDVARSQLSSAFASERTTLTKYSPCHPPTREGKQVL
jgi:hypothetical protein